MELKVRRRPVKYARIEVKPDGTVVITAPESFNVGELVERHRCWLEGKLAEIENLREVAESGFPINGEFYGVIRGRRAKVHEMFRTVVMPPVGEELVSLLRRMLRRGILPMVVEYSERMGVQPGKVYIRHQKSRWGSCSPHGNLSFNIRLIAVPPDLRRYVVIHELAHLKYMNHSGTFWSLVGKFYPDYRDARGELKRWWSILELNPYWRLLEGRG